MVRGERRFIIAVVMVLAGLGMLYAASMRAVTVFVDGKPNIVMTRALTVGGALKDAGIQISSTDRVQPTVDTLLLNHHTIDIRRASMITIWADGGDIQVSFLSAENIPGNLLLEAGIRLFPEDRLYWNGLPLSNDQGLPPLPGYTLQLERSAAVRVMEEGEVQTILSHAAMLGQALWQSGIRLTAGDHLSRGQDTLLEGDMAVVLQRARPLEIKTADHKISSSSASATTGQALVEAGMSLQGLDHSIPPEEQPLPENGVVQVVRAHETLVIEHLVIPFDVERKADPDVDAYQSWVIEPGSDGLEIRRLRVRYDDDRETNRNVDAEYMAVPPVTQVEGYGTKQAASAPIQQLDESIEYWAAVPMYATSYYPCGFSSGCSYMTASGATLEKGVVAVTVEWFRELAGYQVYVPGYGVGVIADTGGGIPGKTWIDLGYGNDDYVSWSETVMVYFLPPAPETIPWFLR